HRQDALAFYPNGTGWFFSLPANCQLPPKTGPDAKAKIKGLHPHSQKKYHFRYSKRHQRDRTVHGGKIPGGGSHKEKSSFLHRRIPMEGRFVCCSISPMTASFVLPFIRAAESSVILCRIMYGNCSSTSEGIT